MPDDIGTTEIEDDLLEAADRIAALEAENEALREDAERYRWLRDPRNELHSAWRDVIQFGCTADEMDAAIDAARRKQ